LESIELFREYEAYNRAVASLKLRKFSHKDHSSVAGRRIRIGYSSPDLRAHASRFFMEPLFRHHDREQFELFLYCNHGRSDNHTARMKRYFDHWIDVFSLSDVAMAERIYGDQIDILIEMAGHTKGNRLSVFAMRPSPIQVASLIGYGYTTGLKEIDYIIADKNYAPVGSEAYFSEQVWRLPAPSIVYDPPRDIAPDVSDPPALRKGYVTFGSMTRLVRLNDSVLRVWKEILNRVPDSRLRLDQKPFAVDSVRELFLRRLEGLGIPRDRVELTCSAPHWTGYHDIDISLDCWPHNAGTIIFESLWMGVPVLSKIDRPSVGCLGATILKPLGLEDWVVQDEINYIEKAVAYAGDLGALTQLRAGLRQRLDASKLLAGEILTRNLESAYRQMIEKKEESSL
jgi:protein O-GlcNAc transferase